MKDTAIRLAQRRREGEPERVDQVLRLFGSNVRPHSGQRFSGNPWRLNPQWRQKTAEVIGVATFK